LPTFTRASGFGNHLKRQSPQPLTFWHWSGVTPYTSSCELAGSCVFDKQSPGIFSCAPDKSGEGLFRSYTRCFAEFLHEESPVRLGLLDLPTCVGLRYGFNISNFRDFSWKLAHLNRPFRRKTFSQLLEMRPKPRVRRICLTNILKQRTTIQ